MSGAANENSLYDPFLKGDKNKDYNATNSVSFDLEDRNSIALSNAHSQTTDRPTTEASSEMERIIMKSQSNARKARIDITIYLYQGLIGIAEIVVGALWLHIIGIVAGGLSLSMGSAGYFIVKHHVFNKKNIKNTSIRYLVRGLWELTRLGLIIITTGFFIIHVIALDHDTRVFPAQCRGGEAAHNCARVTTENPMHDQGVMPFRANTSIEEINKATKDFSDTSIYFAALREDETFSHYRFISAFFGFPDDFYVQLECDGDEVVVNTQSQARLGTGDLGVDIDHIENYFLFLKARDFTDEPCVAPADT